jgi:tRNA(Ile)-lysidine synthase
MKKLSRLPYQRLFTQHTFEFLKNISSCQELEESHCIAVSGGVDSMVLLWIAHQLHLQNKIGPIRSVFIHHHTRPGQDEEANLVKNFCSENDIPFTLLHAHGLQDLEGNFEKRARVLRRKLLLENLKGQELLWLGHHIDDSYEWSIMQRYRSSQPKSCLGIPVKNNKIVRPLLCVTKKQIKHLAKLSQISFLDDPTNLDRRFDRNFLRNDIVPLIQKRYPQYLKHYVNYSNHMAAILNLSITQRIIGHDLFVFKNGALIAGDKFSAFQVQELLHQFSNEDRGKIAHQVLKMMKAIDNGKKGPFHFSGGTQAYFSFELLMIYRQKLKNYDSAIAKTLSEIKDFNQLELPLMTVSDLKQSWKNLLSMPDAMLNMPGLVLVLENKSLNKTLNSSVNDSVFPEVSRLCQSRGIRFVSCLKCLSTWERKKTKLPETLKLLPLWTLSNLFASQE